MLLSYALLSLSFPIGFASPNTSRKGKWGPPLFSRPPASKTSRGGTQVQVCSRCFASQSEAQGANLWGPPWWGGAGGDSSSLTAGEKVDRMTCMRVPSKRHSRYWVYVVQSAEGTYYTGSTNNLGNRLRRHNSGHGAKYLRGRGPVRLVYAKEFRYYRRAIQAERLLKTLTRKRKEELIQIYARHQRAGGPTDLAPTAPNQRCGPNRRFAGAP